MEWDEEWQEPTEYTDQALLAKERSRLAAEWEREREEAIAEEIAEEIATAEHEREAAARTERDWRYKAGMANPPRAVRHHEESAEVAEPSEELSQLRNETELATRAVMNAVSTNVTKLRKELTQLENVLAPRSATTSLSIEMSQLHAEVAQLRQEIGDLRQDLGRQVSAIEETVRRKTAPLGKDVAHLGRQVHALQQEVSNLSRRQSPESAVHTGEDHQATDRRLSAAMESLRQDDRYSHNIMGYGSLLDDLDDR
ncbi:hypothetical protein ACWGKW_44510 [Streptomyces sp. NPDC054766]